METGYTFYCVLNPFYVSVQIMVTLGSIPQERVFINFRDVSADHWALKGKSVASLRAEAAAAVDSS